MSIVDIEASINSIPAKKEELRKALEALQSCSPAFAPFTLQWKDFDDHFSSIEKSIQERLWELKQKERPPEPVKPSAVLQLVKVKEEQHEEEVEPRSELKSLCIEMDVKGLLYHLNAQRKNFSAIRSELISALRYAPDSVKLVFDSLDGFFQPEGISDLKPQDVRRACMIILECFHSIGPVITQSTRKTARRSALDLKGMITDGKGDNSLVVLSFLHLVVTFGLFDFFGIDYVLDLIVLVASRKVVVDLCRDSALEEHVPVLIERLSSSGRHLDTIKFILGFELQEKYPPASVLNAYIHESKKASDVRKKGNLSIQAKNEATTKEIVALKQVLKIVEEYKLESLYSPEEVQKSIQQLERQKAEQKQTAAAASNSNNKRQQLQHQPPPKRPKPSSAHSAPAPAPALHLYAPNQGQHRPPEVGFYPGRAGPLGLTAAPSLYNNGIGSFSSHLVRPSEALPLPSSASLHHPAYYDRPVSYGGYGLSGLPFSFSFPHYL